MREPRLCFVGPHLGNHRGWVLSQGEIAAGLLRKEGYEVLETSSILHPLLRAADMAWTLWRNKKNIDLVILSCYSGRAFRFTETIGALCRAMGLRLIIVLHGGGLPGFFEADPERAKKALVRANTIVAPSLFLADAAAKLGFTSKIVPNVLDVEKFRHLKRSELEKDGPRLLWMRTFHQVYHPELAIDAMAILKRKGIHAKLTMAGQDKGLERACRRKAAELGLQDDVRFAGFLDLQAKAKAFAENDIFLNTNRIDNTPVTVLEAAAAGLPIVATAAGGVPILLENEVAALLSPIEDAEAMAASIVRLIENPELRQRLAEEGRKVAAESSWPAVYAKWREVFQAIS